MRITYIHGCCNSSVPAPQIASHVDHMNKQWTRAIEQGLGGIADPPDPFLYEGSFESDYVFYTNKLNSLAGLGFSSSSMEDDSAEGGVLRSLYDNAELAYINSASFSAPPPLGFAKPSLNDLRNKLLDLGFDAGIVIDNFIRDVSTYTADETARAEIDLIVHQQILQSDVIIAHSLGSVVAYNVLSKIISLPRRPAFITLGSPLAFSEFHERLELTPKVPASVSSWTNLIIRNDIVATHLGKHLFSSPEVTNLIVEPFPNRAPSRHYWGNYLASRQCALTLQPIIGEP